MFVLFITAVVVWLYYVYNLNGKLDTQTITVTNKTTLSNKTVTLGNQPVATNLDKISMYVTAIIIIIAFLLFLLYRRLWKIEDVKASNIQELENKIITLTDKVPSKGQLEQAKQGLQEKIDGFIKIYPSKQDLEMKVTELKTLYPSKQDLEQRLNSLQENLSSSIRKLQEKIDNDEDRSHEFG
jgi:uncharacterized protein YoxC